MSNIQYHAYLTSGGLLLFIKVVYAGDGYAGGGGPPHCCPIIGLCGGIGGAAFLRLRFRQQEHIQQARMIKTKLPRPADNPITKFRFLSTQEETLSPPPPPDEEPLEHLPLSQKPPLHGVPSRRFRFSCEQNWEFVL